VDVARVGQSGPRGRGTGAGLVIIFLLALLITSSSGLLQLLSKYGIRIIESLHIER